MTNVDERRVAHQRIDARHTAPPAEPSLRLQLGMWGTIAGFAAILAGTVWLTWPGPPPDTSRAHAFRDVDLCVLTDSQGVGAEPAKATWSNLQAVATEARIRLSYLGVTGPQTEQRAAQFLATQVQRGCDIIVAVGATQAAGADAARGAYPDSHILTVTSPTDAADIAGKVRPLIPAQ